MSVQREEIGFDPSFMEGLKALKEIQPKRQALINKKKTELCFEWMRNARKLVIYGAPAKWRFSRQLVRDSL